MAHTTLRRQSQKLSYGLCESTILPHKPLGMSIKVLRQGGETACQNICQMNLKLTTQMVFLVLTQVYKSLTTKG
jgi:hypothetical protein